ncbi:MAG: hypothetical protein V7L00_23335 [Nostoc sp.]
MIEANNPEINVDELIQKICMVVRLAFAVVANTEPSILIVDEIFI